VATLGSGARPAGAQTAPSSPNAVVAANVSGFDTHLFRPAMDSKGLFSVNGSDVLGAKEFSVGLILDYSHVLLRTPGNSQLLEHSFQGTLQGNFGIGNQLVVGLDLPIDLISSGANGEPVYANSWTNQKVDFQGVGYVGAHAKWRLTRIERGIGVSLGLQIGAGLGDAASNAVADPGFFYWPMAIVEERFGSFHQFRVAVNAGFRGHAASSTTLQLADGKYADGSLGTFGAGASWRVLESLDIVAETYGTYLLAS